MKYNIPQVGEIEIDTIVLDLNGTLSVNGKIVDGVKERLDTLKELGMKILLLTGDQRGTAQEMCQGLGIEFEKATSAAEKGKCMSALNLETTASIGNARIDIETFQKAKLAIATLQGEGIHTGIIEHVDIIVNSITDALDILIDGDTLCATMRK